MEGFGALGANSEDSMSLILKDELDLLAAFAAFVVFSPRGNGKDGSTNCVNYAEQVIYSVGGNYTGIHGRRPRLTNGELGGKQLKYALNGLRKLSPSKEKVKRPILQP